MGAAAILAVGAGAQAVAGLGQGLAAYNAGKAQKRAYDAQAKDLEAEALYTQGQITRSYDTLVGEQKLNIAASGIELSGSPLLILDQTVRDKETEIANMWWNTRRQQGLLRSAGRQAVRQGRNALLGSAIEAAGEGAKAYAKVKGGSK